MDDCEEDAIYARVATEGDAIDTKVFDEKKTLNPRSMTRKV